MSTKARATKGAEPRKRPTQERSHRLVEAILDATERVLGQDGYSQLTTNRVAMAAGVSIGSLYQYFPTKEALVRALNRRHIDEAIDWLTRIIDGGRDIPLRVCVKLLVRGRMEMLASRKQTLHEMQRVVPELRAFDAEREACHRAILIVRDELVRRANEVTVRDPYAAATIVVYTVNELGRGLPCDRPEMPIEAAAEEVTQMIASYLSLPAAPAVPAVPASGVQLAGSRSRVGEPTR